jgi:hypothetical protein
VHELLVSNLLDFEGLLLTKPIFVEFVLYCGDSFTDAGLEDLLGFLLTEIGLYLLALFNKSLLELVFIFRV